MLALDDAWRVHPSGLQPEVDAALFSVRPCVRRETYLRKEGFAQCLEALPVHAGQNSRAPGLLTLMHWRCGWLARRIQRLDRHAGRGGSGVCLFKLEGGLAFVRRPRIRGSVDVDVDLRCITG